MYIKKENVELKSHHASCTVFEYPLENKELGFATAKINGRYPAKGNAINKTCNLLYFVISGSGTMHTKDGSFGIHQGDAFFIEKNKPYWVEGVNLYIALPSAPAWHQEQYTEVE